MRFFPALLALLALSLPLLPMAGTPDPALRQRARDFKLAAVHGQPSAATLAFSPDGQQIYTAGKDDVLRAWSASDLTLLGTWGNEGGRLRHVAPSPDGRKVAVGDTDGVVRIRELATGRVLLSFPGSGRATIGLAWSPDGTRIAQAALFGPIRELDAETGRPLNEVGGPSEWFGQVNFHLPSGLAAATGKDGDVRVFRMQNGQLLRTLPVEPGLATHFVFSADGRRLAVANQLGQVQVWDPISGRLLQALQASAPLRGLVFGPDALTLISPDTPDRLQVWSSKKDWSLSELVAPPRWIGISPEDSPAAPDPEEQALQFAGVTAAISPDGSRLAEAWDNTLRIWDLQQGKLIASRDLGVAQVTAVDIAPRSAWVAAALDNGKIHVYSALQSAIRGSFALPKGPARAISFAPDGHTLAIAGPDLHIRLWDVLAGSHAVTMFGHEGQVQDVDFSPQGVLASASLDGTLGLWDVSTRQRTASIEAHKQGSWRARWSRDGKLLVAFPVFEAKAPPPGEGPPPKVPRDAPLLFTASGQPVTQGAPTLPAAGRVGLADGKVLLSAGSDKLNFVDLQSGQIRSDAQGPARLRALALSPDGKIIAGGTTGGTVQLIDMQTGALLMNLSGHASPVTAVVWSEDGRLLVSGSEDGTVRVWSL